MCACVVVSTRNLLRKGLSKTCRHPQIVGRDDLWMQKHTYFRDDHRKINKRAPACSNTKCYPKLLDATLPSAKTDLRCTFAQQIEFFTTQIAAGSLEIGSECFTCLANTTSVTLEEAIGRIHCLSHPEATQLMQDLLRSPFPMEFRSRLVTMINSKVTPFRVNQTSVAKPSLGLELVLNGTELFVHLSHSSPGCGALTHITYVMFALWGFGHLKCTCAL